jgi:hypothetical protein
MSHAVVNGSINIINVLFTGTVLRSAERSIAKV